MKIIDKELDVEIPDNEINREVVKNLKKASLTELYRWRDAIKQMDDFSKKIGFKPNDSGDFRSDITLKFIEDEIKKRELKKK